MSNPTVAPWRGVATIREAAVHVEAVARAHGWQDPSAPSWLAFELASATARVGAVPAVLVDLASWYDDSCWSHCINPQQQRQSRSDSVRVDGTRYKAGDSDEWRMEAVRLASPRWWTREESNSIHFASSMWGDDVLFDMDSGHVVMPDHEDKGRSRFVCARSVPEWLVKLALCDGIDLAIWGGEKDKLPERFRTWAIADFNELNPDCDWFR